MENIVAQKLAALVKLQDIDSKVDDIKKIRGDLPEEVQDLEDELIGYQTRIKKFEGEVDTLETEINNRKLAIKDAEKMIIKYDEQQMNVRNNREYDAITKEKELQDLEIQLCNKKIKDAQVMIDQKKVQIDKTEGLRSEREKDLTQKKEELTVIMAETEAEEVKLGKDREKAIKSVEDRLYRSYSKIRGGSTNGLAVVNVKRGACGGCFNMVPPQRQADIREKKKIIACEHCGRVLADVEFYEEPTTKKKKKTTRKKKTTTTKKTTKAKAK